MAEGEFALVRKYLDIALDRTASWVGQHDLYAMLADAAVQQRDQAGLQKYAPLAEEFASRYDHHLYQAIAHRARGVAHRLAGQHEDAGTRLELALGLFQELGARWQIGRTYFELGELAAAQADALSAREHFTRALEKFVEMQAAPDTARTQAALGRLA